MKKLTAANMEAMCALSWFLSATAAMATSSGETGDLAVWVEMPRSRTRRVCGCWGVGGRWPEFEAAAAPAVAE